MAYRQAVEALTRLKGHRLINPDRIRVSLALASNRARLHGHPAEALAYLATLTSFRGAPGDALVRVGADAAIIRATIDHDDGRETLIEAELPVSGRNRVPSPAPRRNAFRITAPFVGYSSLAATEIPFREPAAAPP